MCVGCSWVLIHSPCALPVCQCDFFHHNVNMWISLIFTHTHSLGYQHQGSSVKRPKTDAEIKCESLTAALQQASEENLRLTNRVKELELRVAQLEGSSVKAKTLSEAILIDSVVNG